MCCCLHNYLLDIMVWHGNDIWVGQGYHIGDDGLWLDGNTPIDKSKTNRFLAIRFGQRRALWQNICAFFEERDQLPSSNIKLCFRITWWALISLLFLWTSYHRITFYLQLGPIHYSLKSPYHCLCHLTLCWPTLFHPPPNCTNRPQSRHCVHKIDDHLLILDLTINWFVRLLILTHNIYLHYNWFKILFLHMWMHSSNPGHLYLMINVAVCHGTFCLSSCPLIWQHLLFILANHLPRISRRKPCWVGWNVLVILVD